MLKKLFLDQIQRKHVQGIKIFLDKNKNFDINQINKNKPLYSYFDLKEEVTIDIIKVLLEYGFDLSAENMNDNSTLFQDVCWNYNSKLINFLIDKIDINQYIPSGVTCVEIAIYTQNIELLKLLHKKGADIKNTYHGSCRTTIGSCVERLNNSEKQIEIIDYLINNGVNIDIPNRNNQSPLYSSIIIGKIELAYLLINRVQDFSIIRHQGHTLLHAVLLYSKLSRSSVNIKLIKKLINNGVDKSVKNFQNQTALEMYNEVLLEKEDDLFKRKIVQELLNYY